MYDKDNIEDFFKHGNRMLPSADIIFCTEKGSIVFVDQKENKCYEMRYGGYIGNGFALMQYCTDNNNQWTSKIHWMSHMYWKTLNYNEIGEENEVR